MTRAAFAPDQIVVCLDSFASDAPTRGGVIARGSRLRGDHPTVVAHPTMFVSEGLTDEEFNEARERLARRT